MLHAIAFFSTYFFFAAVLAVLMIRRGTRPESVLFLAGISLIPVGKLFYLPVPGLTSVGMSFVYTSLLAIAAMTLAMIRGIPRGVLLPLVFFLPVMLSLLFLSSTSQEWFLSPSAASGTSETGILRVISVLLITIFSTYCAYYTLENADARRDVAVYFIVATLFATAVGAVIFYGVFIGVFDMVNLQPISRDVHIVDNKIYRFNPGANVNEFGQIIGYALLMLRWTQWKTWLKMIIVAVLLIADFLTLTRAAWLALFVAYFVFFLFSPARTRAILAITAAVGLGLIVIVAFAFDVLTPLLQSRTALSGGVSGDERIASVFGALQTLIDEPFRLLFGLGWAADMYGNLQGLGTNYIHNVPLMILFDTGIFGFMICLIAFAVFFRFVMAQPKQDRAVPLAMMAFMFTISLMHHNFYHVQTWMIFGVLLGDAMRAVRAEAQPAPPQIRVGAAR
jgi:O-antigen ligase